MNGEGRGLWDWYNFVVAHGELEASIGYLGETVEYDFSDLSDARMYREERNRRTLRGRVILNGGFLVVLAGLLYDSWKNFSVVSGMFALVSSVSAVVAATDRPFGKASYTSLVLKLHPGWIGIREEYERRRSFPKPFTEFVRFRQVRAIRWQAEGCTVEYGRLFTRRMFIDRRLLGQEGAVEALEDWAKLHGLRIEGAVPVIA